MRTPRTLPRASFPALFRPLSPPVDSTFSRLPAKTAKKQPILPENDPRNPREMQPNAGFISFRRVLMSPHEDSANASTRLFSGPFQRPNPGPLIPCFVTGPHRAKTDRKQQIFPENGRFNPPLDVFLIQIHLFLMRTHELSMKTTR